MAKPRLTKRTYEYLESLVAAEGGTLYQITKSAGLNHQVLTKWKTSDPKTCEILDAILREIDKIKFRREEIWFQHNEYMLARFDIGSPEHTTILNRLNAAK